MPTREFGAASASDLVRATDVECIRNPAPRNRGLSGGSDMGWLAGSQIVAQQRLGF